MIRAQYMLLCDDARQSLHNTVDLLGLFDRINVPATPAMHRRLSIVALLVADDEDGLGRHSFAISLIDPNGLPMLRQEGGLVLKPEAGSWMGSARMIFTLEMMPLPSLGRYRVVLQVDGRDVASHPLTVVLQKAPA